MTNRLFLSSSEYAKIKGISKMQVTRLIKSGKIPAVRVGRDWAVYADPAQMDQSNLQKNSSLQSWAKLIKQKLNKTINVEKTKDREIMFTKMDELGLPHERFVVFPVGKFPMEKEFISAVDIIRSPSSEHSENSDNRNARKSESRNSRNLRLSDSSESPKSESSGCSKKLSYWLSAVPDPNHPELDRLAKLRINDIETGWKFIQSLPDKQHYKIIVLQYPEDAKWKGTSLVSRSGKGIAEFVTGDRHYLLTRGFLTTDPLLFDKEKIIKYSNTISTSDQDELVRKLNGIYGHFEFEKSTLQPSNNTTMKQCNNETINFFDYSSTANYFEIDEVWNNLKYYFSSTKHLLTPQHQSNTVLYGLPNSPGSATGKAIVLHHEMKIMNMEVAKGDILITDTITEEMTDLLGKVSAISTDLGGVTTHQAIVLRELEIPTIVGCRDATERIKTGDKIKVDTAKGTIQILNN